MNRSVLVLIEIISVFEGRHLCQSVPSLAYKMKRSALIEIISVFECERADSKGSAVFYFHAATLILIQKREQFDTKRLRLCLCA